jgi:hypothetical protein
MDRDIETHTAGCRHHEEIAHMSTEPAQPDAGTDLEGMSLEAVQAELQRYRPGTSSEVVGIPTSRGSERTQNG